MRISALLFITPFLSLILGLAASSPLHADEGMWVFNNLPLEQLKARYGFEPAGVGRTSEVGGGPVQ